MKRKLTMLALVTFLVAAVPQEAHAAGAWQRARAWAMSVEKWWDDFISAPGLNARGLGG